MITATERNQYSRQIKDSIEDEKLFHALTIYNALWENIV